MARFGKNMKLTVDRAFRARTRAFFGEVLGVAPASPMPDLELYKLEDGFQIGVFYAEANDALAEAEQAKGAWLEIEVADHARAAATLDQLGVEKVDYTDKTHAYYRIPGGPVFRLAKPT